MLVYGDFASFRDEFPDLYTEASTGLSRSSLLRAMNSMKIDYGQHFKEELPARFIHFLMRKSNLLFSS